MFKKSLSIFALAMMNVAAIGGLKNWPVVAEYGLSSLFLFLLATLVFFLPSALVSAELATGWPTMGGIYVWVKEAFGHRTGFLAVWLLWIQNVVWYPTSLAFIAGTIAYIINPELAHNKFYTLTIIIPVFWAITLVNFRGMHTSGWISSLGVIVGNFLPGIIIIALGAVWYFQGKPLEIPLDKDHVIPNLSSLDQLVFFAGIILSLCAIEMSAVHAKDVENPQKNYPKAIFISSALIIGSSILGVLAISAVVPQKDISLMAGSMQAIYALFEPYHLQSLVPFMAFLIIIGALASLSTWVAGPSRGLLAAAQGGDLPPFFRKINKRSMPATLLIVQAIIMSLLSLMFIFMPTVNSAFWILTALVAEAYLVMYLLMFAAAIRLRYTKATTPRAYRIPFGNIGMWVIGCTGILSSLFAIIISFFPPAQIPTGNKIFYISFLIIGLSLICLAPSIILCFKKPSWNKQLPHER
jgi:putative glutamate/gamma-aminobutyrate antiporter